MKTVSATKARYTFFCLLDEAAEEDICIVHRDGRTFRLVPLEQPKPFSPELDVRSRLSALDVIYDWQLAGRH